MNGNVRERLMRLMQGARVNAEDAAWLYRDQGGQNWSVLKRLNRLAKLAGELEDVFRVNRAVRKAR